MSPRNLFALLAVLTVLAAACTDAGGAPAVTGFATGPEIVAEPPPRPWNPSRRSNPSRPAPAASRRRRASLPHEWLLRTWRGYQPDRSAEIQILPIEPNYVGSGLPHVGPWPYAQDIPMFWYGPGHVAPAGVVERPVTLAGIAPTQARVPRLPVQHAGRLDRCTRPWSGNATPPKLIVDDRVGRGRPQRPRALARRLAVPRVPDPRRRLVRAGDRRHLADEHRADARHASAPARSPTTTGSSPTSSGSATSSPRRGPRVRRT